MGFQNMIDKVVDWGALLKKDHPITAPLVDKLIGEKEKPFIPSLLRGSNLSIPNIQNGNSGSEDTKWMVESLNPSALFINQDDDVIRIGTAQRMSYLMDSKLRGDRPIVLLSNDQGERKYAVFGTYTDIANKKRYKALQLVDKEELIKIESSDTAWSDKSKPVPLDSVRNSSTEISHPEELINTIKIIKDAITKADSAEKYWKSMVFNGFPIIIAAEICFGHVGLISACVASTATMLRFAQLSHQTFAIAQKNFDSSSIRSQANLFIS